MFTYKYCEINIAFLIKKFSIKLSNFNYFIQMILYKLLK